MGEKKEKKARGQGGEEPKKDTEDDNDTNCTMMLDDDLVLGPETAFLAEGSVHDTGGMVEWAGTVGPVSISFFGNCICQMSLLYFPLWKLYL